MYICKLTYECICEFFILFTTKLSGSKQRESLKLLRNIKKKNNFSSYSNYFLFN